jgi:Fur family ferric uptake transcriptional regulator
VKQVRNTPTKQFILSLISDAGRALSQPEIQEQTEGMCDRVTVYRVLDRLESEGDIHRVVHLDGVVRYAKCQTCEGGAHGHQHAHHHVHFHCTSCNVVRCLERVVPEFQMPLGYEVVETNFSVSGMCPDCRV